MANNIYINGASNESPSVLEIKIPEYIPMFKCFSNFKGY